MNFVNLFIFDALQKGTEFKKNMDWKLKIYLEVSGSFVGSLGADSHSFTS